MIRIFLLFWHILLPGLTGEDSNIFMFVQRNENHTNVSCVTTGEQSAWGISWAGSDSRKIETSGFKSSSEDFVQLFQNESKLIIKNASGFPLPIIMDSRWNGFPIYRGPNTSTVNITGRGINLSLLGPSLTITLNGSLGTLITVNIRETIVSVNGNYTEKLNRNHFEWSHFQLSWSRQAFKVFHNSQKILRCGYDSEIDLNSATFVVHENSTGVLHEYFWYDAKNLTFQVPENEDCLVLYFAMCNNCTLDYTVDNRTERITGEEKKWTTRNLARFQVISTKGTNKDGKVKKEYFAVDVRKCLSEPKMKAITASFESLTEIKCYSFCDGKDKVISYENGTIVGLLAEETFNGIAIKSRFYPSNNNLIVCKEGNECYVRNNICKNNYKQKRTIDRDSREKSDAHVYCHTMDDYTKKYPIRVSVKWKTPSISEMSNYSFRFCEVAKQTECLELIAERCDVSTWENYTCLSSHLKINFDYNLLTYRRDKDSYILIDCKNYTFSEKGKVPISFDETTEKEILTLRVSNSSWSNIAATQLKLTLEDDEGVQFVLNTRTGEPLVYKLTKARPSATYKATLHVQTDQECIDSKVINVYTPPPKLILEEFPTLNCTEQKCTMQFSRSNQPSANSSSHLFVTDVSNTTTLNVMRVDELPMKSCYKVYDAIEKRWTSYEAPSKVSFHRIANVREENPKINFDIQNKVSLYKIETLLINTYYDKVTCTLYRMDTEKYERKSRVNPKPEGEGGINTGIVVALVIVVLLLAAAAFIVYKKKVWGRFPNYFNIRPNRDSRSSAKPRSKLVQMAELEDYVRKALKASGGGEDELSYQFKLCSAGQTHPWDYGKLPANSKKQRYKNIIAYDHSRVVLSKLPGDDFSDYINANYVGERMYIATQGPKKSTTNDFWRMIWEQNSPVIIMLTKFVENDKPKCEKYWPDESETYGEITVSLTSQQYQADYCSRTFNLCKGGANKQVTHLHYELWPDHGVPDCQSLASFMAVIPPPRPTGPQVVHCSAGCGRTGTLILAQMCLKSARETGQVDFLNSLATIRKYRVDLVQNEEQYKVAHLLVLEILFKEDYTVVCDGRLRFTISNRKFDAAQELRYLNNVDWRDTALLQTTFEEETGRVNEAKNRFPNIVPPQHSAVIIPRDPITDAHSDYINAVLIKKFYGTFTSRDFDKVEADYANTVGFYSSAEFIVTQQPLPNTVKDFWRMVLDKEAEIIVSLNEINLQDQSSCVFWREISPSSACRLRFVQSLSKSGGYDVIIVQAESKGNLARTISIINMKNWNAGESRPESRRNFLELVKHVQALASGQISSDRPIILTCHDGATASGLFLSLITALEMVRIENKVDLCRIVRSIRRSRKEFMRNIEQFGFLYDAIWYYLNGHPRDQQVIYSNEEALYSNVNNC